jgi:hypothetical protein
MIAGSLGARMPMGMQEIPMATCPKCGGQMSEQYPWWLSIAMIVCLILAIFTAGVSLLALGGLWFCYRSNRYWECGRCGYTFGK